ncbi:MAG TPA: hypothetical protein VFV99_14710 [Kofleriaceae bacterium]|nr:hypothetical protein [Kofleriaceae bacterium]
MRLLVVALVVCACGGRARPGAGTGPAIAAPTTLAEKMIALLPDGAQLLVEIDLARLKANPAVGPVATQALARLGADAKLPGLPIAVQGSPLANADLIVLAAYGVGTDHAASLTLLATKAEVAGAVRLSPELVVLGPEEWTAQVETRAGIAEHTPIAPSLSLMPLRDHAMPEKAPGAVLRVTGQLPFDARVALARQTGLEVAPAQLSIWADVVDDVAVIIDADAADPGDKKAKDAAARLQTSLTAVLGAVANAPALQGLGLTSAIRDARTITQRTWVRTIITVGPRQLTRAVERARAMLGSAS